MNGKRTYVIKGAPIAWKRSGRQGNYYYDSQIFEKERARIEMLTQDPYEIVQGPIYIDLTFYLPIPLSIGRVKRELLEGKPHDKKPDRDNLEKFIFDALRGVLYTDDAQIADGIVRKIYSLEPRTEIVIYKL
jgi:Holliday junction resolvase RusA-like endonuclease